MHWLILLFLIVLTWAGLFSMFSIISIEFLRNHTSNTPAIQFLYYALITTIALLIITFSGRIRVLVRSEEHGEDRGGPDAADIGRVADASAGTIAAGTSTTRPF